jgi:hypothetical protein
MGQVKENLLTKGFSGRIGDEIVFRQVGNRTLFAKRPRKREEITPTPQTERFAKAVLYAKTVLFDPAVKEEYERMAEQAGFNSAYIAALTDYLKAPEIGLVHTDLYTGAIGSLIWITAVDDFKIKQVTVTLQRADGSVIETGEAISEDGRWKYAATQLNDVLIGTKVLVLAKDRAGKEATAEKVIA